MCFSKTKIAFAVGAALLTSVAVADVKIAVLGPFTSSTSNDFGIGVKEGVALAAAEINAKGGILGGQQITLVQYDDNAKPDKGVEISKAAVSDKVVAGLGLVNTGVVMKTNPIFQEAKIPFLITSSTGGTTGNMYLKEPVNYIFRMAPTDAAKAAFLTKQVTESYKFKKIAIFADASPYGQSGVDFITKNLAEKNMKPLIVERFPVGEVDMEAAAIRARDAGADSVMTWTLGPEAAAVKVSFNRIGWRVPIFGSWTLTSKSFSDNAGPIATNSKTSVSITYDSVNPVTKKFISNYRNFNKRSTIPSLMAAAQSYDGMYLLAMAINQAGSTDGVKIVEAMENLKGTYTGAVTTYEKPWSKTDHEYAKMSDQLQLGVLRQGRIFKAN